jgi:hypothetical protein
MASQFNVEFSVTDPPADARVRAVDALEQPARAVGLRLAKRGPEQLEYRPRVQFPFLLMLWHNINGERMTARFEPGEAGGTRVTISGAVARASHSVAADAGHWSEALGGSA